MSRLVPSRFQIELTLLELDDNGEPVNEYPQQQIVLFGLQAVRHWLDELPARVTDAQHALDTQKGGTANGSNTEVRAPLPGGKRTG